MKAAKPEPARAAAPSPQSQTGTARDFLKGRYGIICLALISLLGLLIYANTFEVPFVFDDGPNIVDNAAIRSPAGLTDAPSFSRIVGLLSFAINYWIHGLDVTGYHVFNLAVHLSCALLVFWLVALTLKTPFFEKSQLAGSRYVPLMIALFSGLIFVSHPVQTQAVTYIVQRFTSLATLFYLLSVVMYAKWRLSSGGLQAGSVFGHRKTVDLRIKKAFLYLASLVSALLAMGTKQIAFTLPAVIALWEFSFFSSSIRKRIINLLPFALVLPVIPLTLMAGDQSLLSASGWTQPPSASDYFLTQSRVIVTYLRLLFFPINQNLDYDYPVYQSLFDPNVLLSFAFLLIIAGTAAFLWRFAAARGERALLRLVAFGIFWFFITLSVESSFIAIADVIFEHRLYLPSIGLIVTAVAVAAMAVAAVAKRFPSVSRVVIPLAAIAVTVLAVAAYERNRVWSNPVTLWKDVAKKSPGKARPHQNLGFYYHMIGQPEKAEAEFALAIDIMPDYSNAHNSLGVIYMDRGEHDRAEAEFLLAIGFGPDNVDAYTNLGTLYMNSGEYGRAEAEFLRAIGFRPDNVKAHFNLGTLYKDRGEYDRAEAEFLRTVDLAPDFAGAYYNLGMNYVNENRFADAIYPFRRVTELDSGDYEAHNNLGNIYAMQNLYDQALQEYQAAVRIKPDYQEAKDNIQLLETMKGQ